MTKTQRRANKRNLIRNSRRYTVVTGMDADGAGHYFTPGTTVRHALPHEYQDMMRTEDKHDMLVVDALDTRFPLKQWVAPQDIV